VESQKKIDCPVMKERKTIKSYHDLDVYKMAIEGAMLIFKLTKEFPLEEKYSLTDQIRRSSRSVCANLGESCLRPRGTKLGALSPLNRAQTTWT